MIRLILATSLLSLPAVAQEALYGAQPPAGSAYVRFANATAAPVVVASPVLPDQTLDTAAHRVTPYSVVEKVAGHSLEITARSGGKSVTASLTLAPDSFVTILLRPAPDGSVSATAAPDGAEFNQARARISFYNATTNCAAGSLSLVPAGTVVFADVPPGANKNRSVNPVTATIRAACTGSAAPDLALSGMDVGGSYSVWLMQPATTPLAFISRDTTLPYKK